MDCSILILSFESTPAISQPVFAFDVQELVSDKSEAFCILFFKAEVSDQGY